MKDEVLSNIAQKLISAGNIVILPHLSADGDALGSALGLGLALVSIDKKVDVLLEEDIPPNMDFLPGQELIKSDSKKQYDVAINIDNSDIKRLGKREHFFHSADLNISIDHHTSNRIEAHYSYVDAKAAATGEIMYDLIANYLKCEINQDIAMCLYTAIITDTGGFRYSNTTPLTFSISAELISFGFDISYVNKRAFDMITVSKLKLIRQTINSMRILEDGKLAISYINFNYLNTLPTNGGDFEGLVDYGRNLEGVEVSAFLREETQGSFKISLRSNDYVDVAAIAGKFDGGGHIHAAGFTIQGELESVILSVVNTVAPELIC